MSCLRRSRRRSREIYKSAIPDYPRVFRDDPLPIIAGIIPDLCIGTAMLLGHDIVADREPQTGPLTTRLGREERLEKLVLDVGRDPNAVEDVLNLAYHGGRAQDQSFNITLERDYIAALAQSNLSPRTVKPLRPTLRRS